MSASRRARKPRYVVTPDRDRIALVAGASCGFVVMLASILLQHHTLLVTVFRAIVAMAVVYAAAHPVVWLIAHLRETQSVIEGKGPESDAEKPESK